MKAAPIRPDRVSTAIRFKPKVHERLRAICDENDLSLNWVVNRLLEEALERVDDLELTFTVPTA